MENFRQMLTGGHPNSLGRTLEVVAIVLSDHSRMPELYECYFSDDEIVRLRTSSSLKRVFAVHPDWFADYADRLLDEITQIDQPSTKWTLAQLWLEHRARLTPLQKARALDTMIHNLHDENDWIVLNMTMKTLGVYAKSDPSIAARIEMRVRELFGDRRKSVAKGAGKLLNAMGLSLI